MQPDVTVARSYTPNFFLDGPKYFSRSARFFLSPLHCFPLRQTMSTSFLKISYASPLPTPWWPLQMQAPRSWSGLSRGSRVSMPCTLTPRIPMTLDEPPTEFTHVAKDGISLNTRTDPWKQNLNVREQHLPTTAGQSMALKIPTLLLLLLTVGLSASIGLPPLGVNKSSASLSLPILLAGNRIITDYVIIGDDVIFLTISHRCLKFLTMPNMSYLLSSTIVIMNLKGIFILTIGNGPLHLGDNL